VPGYLIDLNHVDAFIHEEPGIMAKANASPREHFVWICGITLGEIEGGNRGMTRTTNEEERKKYLRLVKQTFESLRIDTSEFTPEYYGKIMGRIWQNDPPSPKTKTERHLLDLGVDINDVWIAAIAWEHKLTVLTTDKMVCIKKALKEEIENKEVGFDCWI
jgi:tRNA(fMet)-specific endonuclease VapC